MAGTGAAHLLPSRQLVAGADDERLREAQRPDQGPERTAGIVAQLERDPGQR